MLFEKTCIHFSRSIPSLARLLAPLPSAPSHQPATCLLWRCLQRSHGNSSCDQSTKRRAPGNSGCSWCTRLELRFASRCDDLLLSQGWQLDNTDSLRFRWDAKRAAHCWRATRIPIRSFEASGKEWRARMWTWQIRVRELRYRCLFSPSTRCRDKFHRVQAF